MKIGSSRSAEVSVECRESQDVPLLAKAMRGLALRELSAEGRFGDQADDLLEGWARAGGADLQSALLGGVDEVDQDACPWCRRRSVCQGRGGSLRLG